MGQRINQIRQANDTMSTFYRTIESDIYRMYQIPTFPDRKGRLIIDRSVVPGHVADCILSHLKTLQRKINFKIKLHGLNNYGMDLNKEGNLYRIHILAPKEKGKSQEERIIKTIYSHSRDEKFVFDWTIKSCPYISDL